MFLEKRVPQQTTVHCVIRLFQVNEKDVEAVAGVVGMFNGGCQQ